MGKKAPKPPDLKPISDAQLKIADQANSLALEQFGLSKEQFAYFKEQGAQELAFAKEQADKNLALQERALATGEAGQATQDRLAKGQEKLMDQAYGFSEEDRKRYREVAIPLQDRIIDEANTWDSPERQAQQAAQAQADVQRQADAQQRNVDARLSGMGIDPSQMRSGAIANTMALQTAAMGAQAGNTGRQQIQQQGIGMRGQAADMLAGLPSQGAQQQGIASGAGGAASNTAAAGQNQQLAGINAYSGLGSTAAGLRSGAVNNQANWTGSPMQWAGIGNQSQGMASNSIMNAGNVMTQGYQNRRSGFNAQAQATQGMMQGLGALAGGIAGFADGGGIKFYANPPSADQYEKDFSTDAAKVAPEGKAPADVTKKKDSKWGEKVAGVADALSSYGGEMEAPAPLENSLKQYFYADGSQMPQGIPPRQSFYSNGSGGPTAVRQSQDVIPAMLSHGEYVVPADVVRAKGIEFFEKLSKKHHRSGT